MKSSERTSILVAIIFIALGMLFLAFTIFPWMTLATYWPLLFFVLTGGFYLPLIIWRKAQRELAALYIPGSTTLMLGVIFLYNSLTKDWAVWAYAWLLIAAGVGLGLSMAAWLGKWGLGTVWVGIWLLVANVALFSLFAALFGSKTIKITGPVLLVGCGVLLLAHAFRWKAS